MWPEGVECEKNFYSNEGALHGKKIIANPQVQFYFLFSKNGLVSFFMDRDKIKINVSNKI